MALQAAVWFMGPLSQQSELVRVVGLERPVVEQNGPTGVGRGDGGAEGALVDPNAPHNTVLRMSQQHEGTETKYNGYLLCMPSSLSVPDAAVRVSPVSP